MMKKTVVINVVGLTHELIGKNTPFLSQWLAKGKVAYINPCLPAVTCSVQSCYLTGRWPAEHGIVGNGWYFRDECEIKFWRQSNKLVSAPKIWDIAKKLDPSFVCSTMFWWYNMYSTADFTATPRPIYAADGRKFSDCYTKPAELREQLQTKLGTFPLFDFWGPKTSIHSSLWIAKAAMFVEERTPATLTLIYLPHLDYELQRVGPYHPKVAKELQEIDNVCADLISFYESKQAQVIVLSEYGITEVNHPIHLNKILREHGYLQLREEQGGELLDAGASSAFAVADHQLAHIYINDKNKISAVRTLLESIPGIEHVYGKAEKATHHLNHARAGELVAVADSQSWFTYYYWLDDAKAPDFARTVDIHRKPGYDPVELVVDPNIKAIKLKVGLKLLKKKLGFRYLLDVIPLDATLIKGSHGRYPDKNSQAPLIISQQKDLIPNTPLPAIDVQSIILTHLTGKEQIMSTGG
ncbi:phosphonoacetate hydrolase [Legionella beliardensis]|uniref:Phosphonoacetate hydrolase n=1 Tax=Legionella beliardensis TaxID=91822 RepID=A0A378I3H9_9GAMM|nr:nucleotide pyrophosphatase/phosphodiesterase family protein [Legionella beliardensis]STX29729.1 phosphonoacetate hydrolase [Legionella beliardensis]